MPGARIVLNRQYVRDQMCVLTRIKASTFCSQ